jgi:molecular chaperone DnaK
VLQDPIVGIDLGTSNSVVAHADEVGVVKVLADDGGYKIHPSVVSFHPNGGVVIGAGAKQRKVIDPSNTIYSVKRMIGRAYDSPEVEILKGRVPYKLKEGDNRGPLIVTRGGEFAPPEISAIVLDHVRNIAQARLETPVNRAVVTVPASFNDAQRSATATAGAIAGLTVVRVLNEPTAAALAYGNTRNLKEVIAVYDFGGGTFDITILKLNDQVYEVLGTSGDTFLGGDDLDERLVDKMVMKFLAENRIDLRSNEVAMMRLRAVAEQTKIELSRRARAVVRIDEIAYGAKGKPLNLQIEITRDEFVSQVADIIDKTFPVCQEALQMAGLGVGQIDDVILVGGTTKIPYVRDQASKFFAKAPRTDVNPEDAVAVGAALQASSLERILSRSQPAAPARAASASLDSIDSFTDVVDMPGPATIPGLQLTQGEDIPVSSRVKRITSGYANIAKQQNDAARADTAYSMKGQARDHYANRSDTEGVADDTRPGVTDPHDARLPTNAKPLARLTKSDIRKTPPPLPKTTLRGAPLGRPTPPPIPAVDPTGTGSFDHLETSEAVSYGDRETNIAPPPRPPPRPPAAAPNAPTMIVQPDFQGEIDTGVALDMADQMAAEARKKPDFSGELDTGLALDLADKLAAEARKPEFPPSEIDTGVALELADKLASEALGSAATTAKGFGKAPATTMAGIPPGAQLKPPPTIKPPPGPLRPVPLVPTAPPGAATAPPQPGPFPQASPASPTLALLGEAPGWGEDRRSQPGSPMPGSPMPGLERALPTILEVTPRGLGIATVAGFCEELIRRNSRLPATMRKSFSTARDQQAVVRIVVCQGESRRLDNNTVIGDLVLANLPPRPRGETTIDVTFVIDASGILQVSARDAATGAEQRASLDLVGGIQQQDVAASRERIQQLRR